MEKKFAEKIRELALKNGLPKNEDVSILEKRIEKVIERYIEKGFTDIQIARGIGLVYSDKNDREWIEEVRRRVKSTKKSSMDIKQELIKISKDMTASKWANIPAMLKDLVAMQDQIEDWAETAGPEIAEARLHPGVTNVADDAIKSLKSAIFSLTKLDHAVKVASSTSGKRTAEYIHDPEHRSRPSGSGWVQTPKGWSKAQHSSPSSKPLSKEENKSKSKTVTSPTPPHAETDTHKVDSRKIVRGQVIDVLKDYFSNSYGNWASDDDYAQDVDFLSKETGLNQKQVKDLIDKFGSNHKRLLDFNYGSQFVDEHFKGNK